VTDNLLGAKTWGQYVSYRNIDITTLARCLQIKAKLPFDMSISLDSLREFFKIEIPGAAHTADYDTRVTVLVFKALLALV
jgi:DNA polymerase III epsilon subunit-like protein